MYHLAKVSHPCTQYVSSFSPLCPPLDLHGGHARLHCSQLSEVLSKMHSRYVITTKHLSILHAQDCHCAKKSRTLGVIMLMSSFEWTTCASVHPSCTQTLHVLPTARMDGEVKCCHFVAKDPRARTGHPLPGAICALLHQRPRAAPPSPP